MSQFKGKVQQSLHPCCCAVGVRPWGSCLLGHGVPTSLGLGWGGAGIFLLLGSGGLLETLKFLFPGWW